MHMQEQLQEREFEARRLPCYDVSIEPLCGIWYYGGRVIRAFSLDTSCEQMEWGKIWNCDFSLYIELGFTSVPFIFSKTFLQNMHLCVCIFIRKIIKVAKKLPGKHFRQDSRHTVQISAGLWCGHAAVHI